MYPDVRYDPDVGRLVMRDPSGNVRFRVDNFCPIALGQVLHSRYRILALLNWGRQAMVWLAVDDLPRYLRQLCYFFFADSVHAARCRRPQSTLRSRSTAVATIPPKTETNI